jgi:hypothetical protein
MPLNVGTVKQIFLAALEKAAGPERRRVDAMLQAHAASGGFPDFVGPEAPAGDRTEAHTPPAEAAPPEQPAADGDDGSNGPARWR